MQGPVALLKRDRIRIYFAARNAKGRSYPGYVDVARNDPREVLHLQTNPILSLGPAGAFDDDGIMPACAVTTPDGGVMMYYSGWNRRVTIPYHNTIGLAWSPDGGASFQRAFDGPIMDRSVDDPLMVVTPWVSPGDTWRMWYVAGSRWVTVNDKLEPIYAPKYAESRDGISWDRQPGELLRKIADDEAIARPTVIERDGVFHMWFCFRRSQDFRDGVGGYRLGYAQSRDGRIWHRHDELAGAPAREAWDAKMQCYPYLLDCYDRLLLFYNGNGFGQTGIGCAVWDGLLPLAS